LHAYRSFRLFGAYKRWPDNPVFTARGFGELWKNLMEGFVAHHSAVDGMMIKYEDLVAGKIEAEKIVQFAGVRCDFSVLSHNVSGRGKRNLEPVPAVEKRLLARAVGTLASEMGYAISEEP
jgi:hypothetical protein